MHMPSILPIYCRPILKLKSQVVKVHIHESTVDNLYISAVYLHFIFFQTKI